MDKDAMGLCAKRPPMSIHAVIVRKEMVVNVGGFDPGLATNEDWDLWLRCARIGAKFAVVPRKLAFYWWTPGSLTMSASQMTRDFQTVLSRARRPDPRLAGGGSVAPFNNSGESLCVAGLWNALSSIARGGRAEDVLEAIMEPFYVPWNLADAGGAMVDGIAVGAGRSVREVIHSLSEIAPEIADLFDRLGRREHDPRLSYTLWKALEREAIRAGRFGGRMELRHTVAVKLGLRAMTSGVTSRSDIDSAVFKFPLLRPVRHFMFEGPLWNGRMTGREVRALFREHLLNLLWRLAQRFQDQLEPPLQAAWGAAAAVYRKLKQIARRIVVRSDAASASPTRERAAAPSSQASTSAPEGARMVLVSAYADVAAAIPPPSRESGQGAPTPYGVRSDLRGAWDAFFRSRPDPWDYDSPYEQTKYERTLDLISEGPVGRALELACAEGRFTLRLAQRCDHVCALDVSEAAVERAKERCSAYSNVTYVVGDFFDEPIEGQWDLIVCSEVLYYVSDSNLLYPLAKRLRDALNPGGRLLLAHAYELSDEPARTGMDWEVAFGAKVIEKTFARVSGLRHVKSRRTPLYQIDLFERSEMSDSAQVEDLPLGTPLEPSVARSVVWNGAILTRAQARSSLAFRIPVLMYHRVSDEGPPELAQYRVSPRQLEHQLRFLRRRGYRSITPDLWEWHVARGRPITGRPVILTFDDAYADFVEAAWPIVQRNGFSAHVFAPVDKIGGRADWDAGLADPAPLMSWEHVKQLRGEVSFGSHLTTHVRADSLDSEALLYEAARSKAMLERVTGCEVITVAPPYGAADQRVRQVLKIAGFTRVFSSGGGAAPVFGRPLSTPRVWVRGDDDIWSFADKLGRRDEPPEAADEPDAADGSR